MKRCARISCWTDYPLISLGDVSGQRAPIRRVTVVHYDQNKYATVMTAEGNMETFKWGYLYRSPGRRSEGGRSLNRRKLERMISTRPLEIFEGLVTGLAGDEMSVDLLPVLEDDVLKITTIKLSDVPAADRPLVRKDARFTLTLYPKTGLRPARAQEPMRLIAFEREQVSR